MESQGQTVIGRIEGVKRQNPDLVKGRCLDSGDQAGKIQVVSLLPVLEQYRGQQDMVAAFNRIGIESQKTQQAGCSARCLLPQQLVIRKDCRWRRGEGLEDRYRYGGRTARSIEG